MRSSFRPILSGSCSRGKVRQRTLAVEQYPMLGLSPRLCILLDVLPFHLAVGGSIPLTTFRLEIVMFPFLDSLLVRGGGVVITLSPTAFESVPTFATIRGGEGTQSVSFVAKYLLNFPEVVNLLVVSSFPFPYGGSHTAMSKCPSGSVRIYSMQSQL